MRIRLIAFALSVVVGSTVLAMLSLFCIERIRNAQEEYVVYSAYLSHGILEDAHDWSVRGPIEVVVEDTTHCGNMRWRGLCFVDQRVGFERLNGTTRASFIVRNLLRTHLEAKFNLPKSAIPALASAAEIETVDFQKNHPHNMGYITLSGVGFNLNRTQAVFYINHFCGLCGGGRYVLMEKTNGKWEVTAEHYTWIS